MIRFNLSVSMYESQTAMISGDTSDNHYYQAIIDEGAAVLPLIYENLRSKNNLVHWYPALRAITGANPVPLDDRGFVKKMDAHWINWLENYFSISEMMVQGGEALRAHHALDLVEGPREVSHRVYSNVEDLPVKRVL